MATFQDSNLTPEKERRARIRRIGFLIAFLMTGQFYIVSKLYNTNHESDYSSLIAMIGFIIMGLITTGSIVLLFTKKIKLIEFFIYLLIILFIVIFTIAQIAKHWSHGASPALIKAQRLSDSINTNVSGRWKMSMLPYINFSLYLHQNKSGSITGSHVSIQESGNKIDSGADTAEITINGAMNYPSQIATVTFKSRYCNKTGIATIQKINAHQIIWKITTPPKGKYFIPDIDTLNKE
jgi:hypothetical protein